MRIEEMTRRVLAVESPTRNRDPIYGSRSSKEASKVGEESVDFKVAFDSAMEALKQNRR